MKWTRKDLVALSDLSAEEITLILDTAAEFKGVGQRRLKKVPSLRGKTLVNFFVEASTRTRTSFELAAVRLSADVVNIAANTSSLSKGESLKDTAKNLEALAADLIVLRHSAAGAPQFLAERLRAGWESFVMEDLGVRCVSDEPWITASETAEASIAHAAVGDTDTATRLLGWTRDHRLASGAYLTGLVHPERIVFPADEHSSYTAAAVILAVDAIRGDSPASRLFRHD